jgi:hypothetical protein
MTEEEAKTKRCPIIRTLHPYDDQDGYEHHSVATRMPHCIASECMMWRQSYTSGDDGFCGVAGAGGPYGYPPGAIMR